MIVLHEKFNKENITKIVAQAIKNERNDAFSIYDKNGEPLLTFAIKHHFNNLATLIINKSATSLFQADREGNCPLHVAIMTEDFEIAKKIIAKHPQTMRVFNHYQNMTPFHIAAQKNLVEFGSYMISVDPRIVDDEIDDDLYNSAIHICGANGCTEFAKMLVSRKQQVLEYENFFGKTAEDIARENNYLRTAEVLKSLKNQKIKD